jgi:hypothetical protein
MNINLPNINQLKGIVDSGNSYIHLPSDLFIPYSKLWNVRKEMNGKYHSVPCNSKIKLSIKIRTNTYELSEKELVLNQV